MIVWKVTTELDSSIAMWGKANVRYKIGKTTKAPRWLREIGYHLFAFGRLKDAKNFTGTGCRIYKAEAKKTTRELPPFLNNSSLAEGIEVATYDGFPIGTIMCEEITLLKRVM